MEVIPCDMKDVEYLEGGGAEVIFGAGTTAAGAETTAVDDRAGESRSRVNQAEEFKGGE